MRLGLRATLPPLVSATKIVAVAVHTTPESDGPTRAGARCTRAGCCRAIGNRSSPSSSGRTSSCRRARPRAPASASVLASTYHWSVSQGSMTTPERSPCGTVWACGSIFSSKPSRLHHLDDALARLEAVRPSNASVSSSSATSGTSSRKSALSLSETLALRHRSMLISAQIVPLADLEIVEVMRRRDLHRAGALLGIGIVVGDDRDQPADQRQAHLLARPVLVALVVRDAPRRRCRPASSRAASSRPTMKSSVVRIDRLVDERIA